MQRCLLAGINSLRNEGLSALPVTGLERIWHIRARGGTRKIVYCHQLQVESFHTKGSLHFPTGAVSSVDLQHNSREVE